MWSTEMEPTLTNFVKSYLYGTWHDISESRTCIERMISSYVVAVPCYDIEGSMLLRRGEELATKLVYNIPVLVVLDLVVCNRVEEVPSICKTIGSERTKFRKLKVGAPDLENVTTRRPVREVNLVFLTTLDNADLAGLHEQLSKLGLNVESTLLGDNEEVAVGVNESTLVHGGVGAVDVAVKVSPRNLRTTSFKTYVAIPSLNVGSPEPAIVLIPSTKSTDPDVGMSKGVHASCVGETCTFLLIGKKQDSISSLSGRSLKPWWATAGRAR